MVPEETAVKHENERSWYTEWEIMGSNLNNEATRKERLFSVLFPVPTLLDRLDSHISPIAWSNVIIYGDYKPNKDLVK